MWLAVVVSWLVSSTTAHAYFVNYAAREINFKIVYVGTPTVGTAAVDNVRYIYDKTEADSRGQLLDLAPGGGERQLVFDFSPQTLGEMRGFRFRFHLYTAPTTKAAGDLFALTMKGFDGIVFIADAAPAHAKANLAALADLKRRLSADGIAYEKASIVFELVGTDRPGAVAVADLAKALDIGNRPMFEADLAKGVGVFDTLKAIAKALLVHIRDTDIDQIDKYAKSPSATPAVKP